MSTQQDTIDDVEDNSTVTEKLRLDRARAHLKAVRILSVSGLLGILLLGSGVWILLGNQIKISDEIKVFAVSLVGFGIVFSPATIWGVKKLWNPDLVYVARVNAGLSDIVNMYVAAPDKWDDVTVVSGDTHTFTVAGQVVHLVTDFRRVEDVDEDDELADHVPDDADGWIAAGSWMGEASDAEIVTERHQIDGNRRRNNAWARIGEKLYAQFESIAKSVESRHHKAMTDKSMDMTLYDSDTVKQEAAEAIPELDEIDESQAMPEIIEDEVNRQLKELNTPDAGGESNE